MRISFWEQKTKASHQKQGKAGREKCEIKNSALLKLPPAKIIISKTPKDT